VKQKTMLGVFVIAAILFADIVSKQWALVALGHGRVLEAFGGLVPLTLAFNQGVAFGLPLPWLGRWLVIGATAVVLYVLATLFAKADESDWLRLISIELVAAGALGNLVDRVRWDQGVVDFIGPINLKFAYLPIFNVADMAITVGAIALGVSLWREEARAAAVVESTVAVEETGS
jgi:signal peptidase II